MSFINTATIGEGYEGLANAVIIRALVDYYDAQRTIKEYRSRLHILEETHASVESIGNLRRKYVNANSTKKDIEAFAESQYWTMLTKLDGDMLLSYTRSSATGKPSDNSIKSRMYA